MRSMDYHHLLLYSITTIMFLEFSRMHRYQSIFVDRVEESCPELAMVYLFPVARFLTSKRAHIEQRTKFLGIRLASARYSYDLRWLVTSRM